MAAIDFGSVNTVFGIAMILHSNVKVHLTIRGCQITVC